MKTYKFEISGVTPLLMHHNNIEERDRIEALRKRMKGGKPGDDRSPAESWKGYVYASEDTGNLCIPSENLLACLLQGGSKVKVGGKETLKTHSQRVGFDRLDYDLLVNGAPITHASIEAIAGEFGEHATAARALGFRLHVKPCTVGTSKHVRVRPLFTNWSVRGGFDIDDEESSIPGLTAMRHLFTGRGRPVRSREWRPGVPRKPGQDGKPVAGRGGVGTLAGNGRGLGDCRA